MSSTVKLIKDCKIGNETKIMHFVNLYGCTIGDNCFVGPFVEIQNNTKIGNDTRISSHTFICENVRPTDYIQFYEDPKYTDVLKIDSDVAAKIDATLSIMEIT